MCKWSIDSNRSKTFTNCECWTIPVLTLPLGLRQHRSHRCLANPPLQRPCCRRSGTWGYGEICRRWKGNTQWGFSFHGILMIYGQLLILMEKTHDYFWEIGHCWLLDPKSMTRCTASLYHPWAAEVGGSLNEDSNDHAAEALACMAFASFTT